MLKQLPYNKQKNRGILHHLIPHKGARINFLLKRDEQKNRVIGKSFHNRWSWCIGPSGTLKMIDHSLGITMSESLSYRITAARERSKLTKTALADKLGVTRAAISQWEAGKTGDMKARYFFPLADVLKEDPAHLFTGEPTSNSQWARQEVRFVPLLEATEIEDATTVKERNYIPTTIDVTDGFAIRLTSDSMSGIDSSFNSNSTVIFDKCREWNSGDFVLAKATKNEEPMFRQIVVDGASTYLKPINNQYPTVKTDSGLTVFGVAVETLNIV